MCTLGKLANTEGHTSEFNSDLRFQRPSALYLAMA